MWDIFIIMIKRWLYACQGAFKKIARHDLRFQIEDLWRSYWYNFYIKIWFLSIIIKAYLYACQRALKNFYLKLLFLLILIEFYMYTSKRAFKKILNHHLRFRFRLQDLWRRWTPYNYMFLLIFWYLWLSYLIGQPLVSAEAQELYQLPCPPPNSLHIIHIDNYIYTLFIKYNSIYNDALMLDVLNHMIHCPSTVIELIYNEPVYPLAGQAHLVYPLAGQAHLDILKLHVNPLNESELMLFNIRDHLYHIDPYCEFPEILRIARENNCQVISDLLETLYLSSNTDFKCMSRFNNFNYWLIDIPEHAHFLETQWIDGLTERYALNHELLMRCLEGTAYGDIHALMIEQAQLQDRIYQWNLLYNVKWRLLEQVVGTTMILIEVIPRLLAISWF